MSRTLSIKLTLLSVLALPAMVAPAAVITMFTDRASFIAATSGVTTVTFDGVAPAGGSTPYFTSTGYTASGVNFTAPNDPTSSAYTLIIIDQNADPVNHAYDYGAGGILASTSPNTTATPDSRIVATLPTGVTAVGSDIMGFDLVAPPVFTVTLASGATQTFTGISYPSRPQHGFIGFTSLVPITSISFKAINAYPFLDNFSFGTTATLSPSATTPVPLPPAMASGLVGMAGLGLTGIVRSRKRK